MPPTSTCGTVLTFSTTTRLKTTCFSWSSLSVGLLFMGDGQSFPKRSKSMIAARTCDMATGGWKGGKSMSGDKTSRVPQPPHAPGAAENALPPQANKFPKIMAMSHGHVALRHGHFGVGCLKKMFQFSPRTPVATDFFWEFRGKAPSGPLSPCLC